MTFVHPLLGLVTPPPEMSTSVAAKALSSLTQNYYPTMQVELDQPARALFCFMRPDGRPSYTPELLRDMSRIQQDIYSATSGAEPFRYVVVGSRVAGTFNLGGDLDLFGTMIRAGAREAAEAISGQGRAFSGPAGLPGGLAGAHEVDVYGARNDRRRSLQLPLKRLILSAETGLTGRCPNS